MLEEIGDVSKVGEFIKKVKDKNSGVRLMGFGHRVYKNHDPRAKLMRETCHEVLNELGLHDDRLFKLAIALEKIALEDEYFVSRKLYPNVDFYSGIVQRALGIPVSMFTCIFSLARTVGWIAQWQEMISDPEYKIGRPRQLYTGRATRREGEADRARGKQACSVMKQFLDNSYLFGGNAPFVEELYEKYLADPASRAEQWRGYFDKLQLMPRQRARERRGARAGGRVLRSSAQSRRPARRRRCTRGLDRKQVSVHPAGRASTASAAALLADLDPLKRQRAPHIAELEPGYYDLTDADMDTVFNTGTLIGPEQVAAARHHPRRCRRPTAARSASSTCIISSRAEKRWIQERLEPMRSKPSFAPDYKKHILERLTAAEGLERYLHTRYVGQKRFSLEGGETPDPGARQPAAARGRSRRAGAGDRHGAPRAPERAGQHAGQDAEGPVRRIRGQARRRAARGRREVPPGLLLRHQHAGRADAPDARLQSVAPGDRQSGGRRLGAGAPAPPQGPRRRRRCCRC